MQKVSRGVRSNAASGRTSADETRPAGTLGVPELVLVGVGGIIGAGFFLGSGLPIRTAGPAVLLAYLLGGLVTAQVIGALATLAVHDPEPGSFMAYARSYIGNYAGFLNGWGYYVASILTIASEAVAMSIFTKLWLPHIPSWCMASAYVLIILAINAFGVKNFGRVESLMSVVKIAALTGFVVFTGFLLATGSLWHIPHVSVAGWGFSSAGASSFFPNGASGLFKSMLIVIFAYGGIGVFATAAPQMRHPKEIDRAAWMTVGILVFLYLASIGLLLLVVPWQRVDTAHSPFVLALAVLGAPIFAQIFNAIILVAAFSVMAGAVFAANQILQGLGEARSAPPFVTRPNRRGVQGAALAVTAASLGAALLVSFLLPGSVYNFLISATSYLTFLNWFLILWSFLSWRRRTTDSRARVSTLAFGQPWSGLVTMVLILAMAGYALLEPDQRLGFFAFVALSLLISGAYFLLARKDRRRAAG